MAEVEDGGFVRHRRAPKINAAEAAQDWRLVKCVFGSGIGEREPVLQKVNPQHNTEANRLTSLTSLGIVWRDAHFQLSPRNDGLHGRKKVFAAALASIIFKTRLCGECKCAHCVLG